MEYTCRSGNIIQVDEDGFLLNSEDWTEAIAEEFARNDGINELTDKHWVIIDYLRMYYSENGIAPLIRRLCEDNFFTLKQIYELFSKGPVFGACRIAGLAKPDGCV